MDLAGCVASSTGCEGLGACLLEVQYCVAMWAMWNRQLVGIQEPWGQPLWFVFFVPMYSGHDNLGTGQGSATRRSFKGTSAKCDVGASTSLSEGWRADRSAMRSGQHDLVGACGRTLRRTGVYEGPSHIHRAS